MTEMLKTNESSAIVSLQELMALEEQRLRQEEAERQNKAEAARRTVEERLARERREEEQRLEQERLSREAQQQKEREHEARLAAMRQGIIEQERIKAERQAQQDQEALRLAHEREQARILQQSDAKKLRRMLIGVSLGATALIAGGLGLYFGKIRPAMDAQATQAHQATEEAQLALDNARRATASSQEEIDRLQRELNTARTPREKALVQQQIDQLPRKDPRTVAPPAKTTTTATKPPCPVGDPLCY